MAEPTIESVSAYIKTQIASFQTDPAESDFQRGFEAAMRLVGQEALGLPLQAGYVRRKPLLLVIDGGAQ